MHQQPASSKQSSNKKIIDPYVHCGFAHSPHTEGMPKPAHPQRTEAEIYNARGIAYSESGEHDLAIATFDKSIELQLDYIDAHYNRRLAYVRKGEVDKALADYSGQSNLNVIMRKLITIAASLIKKKVKSFMPSKIIARQ